MKKYDPTLEQNAIIKSDASALIIAGPGRGKTATAIAAADAWLKRNPEGGRVLFTSFSNAAVRRIGEAAGISLKAHEKRLHFRTFHSVAMEVLRDFGRFGGLKRPIKTLDKPEERMIAVERGWDQEDKAAYAENLRKLAQEEGRVAFDLMIPVAIGLLRKSETIQRALSSRFQFIVVDEFQDTKADQWRLLQLIGRMSRVLALGDPDQMIYEDQYEAAMRRAAEFEAWKGVERTRLLGKNFRCEVPQIIEFAEALLNGTRYELPKDGVQLFAAYPQQVRASLAVLWREIRKQAGQKSTVAFIAPSASTAQRIADNLKAPATNAVARIPIHARMETSEADFETFRLAVCAGADWVIAKDAATLRKLAMALAVFGAHWSRKTANRARADAILKHLSPGGRIERPVREYLSSCVLGNVRDFAEGLLTAMEGDKLFETEGAALRRQGVPSLKGITFGQGRLFDDYRLSRAPHGLEGFNCATAATTMLSMYRCKGREFDFVVMVVEPRAHSQSATTQELRRLYYVTATRAKKWLGVMHVTGRPGPVLGPVLGE